MKKTKMKPNELKSANEIMAKKLFELLSPQAQDEILNLVKTLIKK